MSQASGSNAPPSPADGNETHDASLLLPLIDLPTSHPCHKCGECCHYVAVEIDDPSSFTDYDNIFWYLTHRGICVYIDWEGAWFIEFATPCESLTPQGTCGIYEERPKICSDFSWNECERSTKERAWKHRFDTPDELFLWVKERRPRSFERYQKARRRALAKRGSPLPGAKPGARAKV
jgi:uncharacterized protein